jgi:alpha-glucosidase
MNTIRLSRELLKDGQKNYADISRAVGEIAVSQDRVGVYASPEGLGQAFAFDILKESYHADSYIKTIKKLYGTARSTGSTTTWVLSSHDVSSTRVLQ